MILSLLKSFAELLIPTRCRTCQLVGPAVFCEDCIALLEKVGDPHCARCGRRRHTSFASPDCAECSNHEIGVARARSHYIYNEMARHSLAEFKFKGHTGVGKKLTGLTAAWTKASLAETFAEPGLRISAVVPVPLHHNRLRKRRFNQAQLIARELAETHELACYPDLILRVKDTETQVGLTTRQRFDNVKKAFTVNPMRKDLLDGRNLLLVDDLMTTGATLAACAKALRRSGAGVVYGLTLFSTTRDVEPGAKGDKLLASQIRS